MGKIIRCIIFPYGLPKELKLKFKLYQKSSGYLMKYIDIFYLIRMVDDVQKLKSILLNNHQIALFNYISKPMISLHNDDEKEEGFENYLSHLEKFFILSKSNQKELLTQDIIKYYGELKANGGWTLIDKKLFDYLDEKFKKILKMSCPLYSNN